MSKIQMFAVGCLSATVLAGAVNVPSASAADYGYGYNHEGVYSRNIQVNQVESRFCRNLRRRIIVAKQQGNYRLAYRLEREYRRYCLNHR